MNGTKKSVIRINTFPANIFPKRRNENEISRAISLKSSIIPMKNARILSTLNFLRKLKLTNFPAYLKNPRRITPASSIETNAIIANAIVMLRSVFAGYRNGTTGWLR